LARALEDVEAGQVVFVDATIFVYHFTGVSAQCRSFLQRCEALAVDAVTSTAVLAEVTHRLMALEAVSRRVVSPGNEARKLAERPEVVKQLDAYHRDVESIPLMGIKVEGLVLSDLLGAHELRRKHGLLTNDSLVAAAALELGASLASADAAFSRVPRLTVFAPKDVPGGA
jgi:predicted nucleic acid-binding protein